MKRLLTFALATLVITSTAAAFGADNSLGTWKLNAEKSKYSPGPLPVKSITSVREAAGDGVKVTNTGSIIAKGAGWENDVAPGPSRAELVSIVKW